MTFADLEIGSIVVLRYSDCLMEAKLIHKEIYVRLSDYWSDDYARLLIILERADGKKLHFAENISYFTERQPEFKDFIRFAFESEEDAINNKNYISWDSIRWTKIARTALEGFGIDKRWMFFNGGTSVGSRKVGDMRLVNDTEWEIRWDDKYQTITDLKENGIFARREDALALCKPKVVRFSNTTEPQKRHVRITLMKEMYIEDESDIAIPNGYEIKDVTEI